MANVDITVRADLSDAQQKFAQLKGDLDGLSGKTNETGKAADQAAGLFEKYGKVAAVLTGVAIAAGAVTTEIVAMAREAGRFAESMQQLSLKTGISTTTLQEWNVAFAQQNISLDRVVPVFRQLAKNFEQAEEGSKKALEKFQALGLSADDLKKLKEPSDLIAAIADRVSNMTDPMARAAAVTAVMGRAGMELIPVLMGGAEGFRQSAEAAHRMGSVLSEGQIEKLGAMDDSFDRLGIAFDAFKRQVGAIFAPSIAAVVEGLTSMLSMSVAVVKAMGELPVRLAVVWTQMKERAVVLFREMSLSVITSIGQMVTDIQTWLGGRLAAAMDLVRVPVETVKKLFSDLRDHVTGHSEVPDMVKEIGDHMKLLDIALTAPARAATRETAKVFTTLRFTTKDAMGEVLGAINYSWGSAVQTTAGALASMIVDTNNWAKTAQQLGKMVLTNFLTTGIQMMAQWAIVTAFGKAQNMAQTGAHTAMESAKTAATTSGETMRIGIMAASNKAQMASIIGTLGGLAAIGQASMAIMETAVVTVSGIMDAIGSALVAGIFTSEIGAVVLAASQSLLVTGSAAVAGGMGALQGALGGAVAAATAALATPFATGGMISGPVFSLIGEASSRSNPEVVAPLSDLKTYLGGQRGSIIHTHVYLDGRQIALAVADPMMGALRRKGLPA